MARTAALRPAGSDGHAARTRANSGSVDDAFSPSGANRGASGSASRSEVVTGPPLATVDVPAVNRQVVRSSRTRGALLIAVHQFIATILNRCQHKGLTTILVRF